MKNVTSPLRAASVEAPLPPSMTDVVRPTTAIADRDTALRYAAYCALIVAGLMVPIAIVVALFQPSWTRTTVWLPVETTYEASGRTLIFRPFQFNLTTTYSDYRRRDKTVTD